MYIASAWSCMYIGRWMCKTEGSPTGLGKKFVRLNGWKSLDNSGRVRTSGNSFWSRSTRSRFGSSERTKITEIPVVLYTFWNWTSSGHTKINEIHVLLPTFWNWTSSEHTEINEIPVVLLTFFKLERIMISRNHYFCNARRALGCHVLSMGSGNS